MYFFDIMIRDFPQWITLLITLGTLFKAWQSERTSRRNGEINRMVSEAVEKAIVKITQIQHETNSMRAELEKAAQARGELIGQEKERDRK
jgi:hypothetical protein